ncbi:hypothetical protein K523DRAFT_359229 [Schizophyllum commune Tattone D]|nr:hypothetical protein K523DRAFT_359229 [Schizophyllum commune Tattone D]
MSYRAPLSTHVPDAQIQEANFLSWAAQCVEHANRAALWAEHAVLAHGNVPARGASNLARDSQTQTGAPCRGGSREALQACRIPSSTTHPIRRANATTAHLAAFDSSSSQHED